MILCPGSSHEAPSIAQDLASLGSFALTPLNQLKARLRTLGTPLTMILSINPGAPRRWPAAFAAMISAALTCASSTAYPYWWLSFVAWVPLLWATEQRAPGQAFRFAWLTGFLSVFVAFGWMPELLGVFGNLSKPFAILGHAIFSAYHGLMWALPFALAALLAQGHSHRRTWALPLSWGVIEVLLPQVFNVHIGYFWAPRPDLIQAAELVGATGVSMLLVLTNALLYRALQNLVAEPQLKWTPIAAWLAVIAANPFLGRLRISQIEQEIARAPKVKIGVVQGNFGIRTRRKMSAQSLAALQQKSAELEAQGADMILWGETTYPYPKFMRDATHDFPEGSRLRVRKGFSLPLIFGLVTRKQTQGRHREIWNTAMVLQSDDRIGDTYDKVYPLWFGEHAPFVDPKWYLKTFPNASHINRGTSPRVLEVNGHRFGPLICYEDLLPVFTTTATKLGVNALLAMNNESWFGRSNAQLDHLGLSVFRAVEQRRPLVRAVNAGVSTYVTPTGAMTLATKVTDSDKDGLQGPDGFVAEVPMMDAKRITIYARFGTYWRWGLCLLTLGLAGRALVERRKRLSSHDKTSS